MPIYEYKCNECGFRFEVLVFSGDKKILCEKCGSENPVRLLSGFATGGGAASSTASCAGSGGFS